MLDYREQVKKGSEQSTNFRWWDLASYSGFIQRREDLKHPPTAVGGIWTFYAKPRGTVKSNSTASDKLKHTGQLSSVHGVSDQLRSNWYRIQLLQLIQFIQGKI